MLALLYLTSSVFFFLSEQHFFSRRGPLTQINWDNLRNYTRRVRCIYDLRWLPYLRGYLELLSNPPTTEPIFPNLRYLRCRYNETTIPLLNLPLPSLTYLDVAFLNPTLFQDSVKSFPKFSPNIRELSFHIEDESHGIEPNYLCHWQNLCSVVVPTVALEIGDLLHLSRMPALTNLEFALRRTLPDFDSSLSFSNLQHLALDSNSLNPISRLLSRTRLPALTDFRARVSDCPSRPELASLFGILTSNASLTINKLGLIQVHPPSNHVRLEALLLGSEDLRPCMAFSDLRQIQLEIECNVCLTDSDLLTLASAWPKLEDLQINTSWGWNSQYGITPCGLIRLLQTCRSLNHIALRLNTRGYTQVPPSDVPGSLGLSLQPKVMINVLDAAIETESVPAIAAFFSGIAACCQSGFGLDYWNTWLMKRLPNAEEYRSRWGDVCTWVQDSDALKY